VQYYHYPKVRKKVVKGGSIMKFIREIPMEKITNEVMALEQFGFTLVYKEDSVEVWAQVVAF